MENGVSKKDPSKTRRSFFPSLKIRPCSARHSSGNNCSSHHGNTATHFLYSTLFRVDSTVGTLLATDACLPYAQACRRCSAVMQPENLGELWWLMTRLS